MARNPWKKLLRNIRISGRMRDAHLDKAPKNVMVTWEELKEIFKEQNKRCYWLGIPLNPQDIFISYYPLAMSADRIDGNADYHKDNIVICSRFANLGRSQYGAKEFEELMQRVKHEIVGSMLFPKIKLEKKE
jgi:hypothetical protein